MASTTGDAEGEIIEISNQIFDENAFQAACLALTGKIRQVPPMFSALKHEGKPLYEYARKGISIERKAREICIYQIDLLEFAFPQAVIDVRCSKGTYIRTLSEDIAKHIGTFAHLTALRRTATAGFHIAQTHTLEKLTALSEMERDALLLPCDVLVQHLPRVDLDDETVQKLRFGQRATFSGSLNAHSPIRAYDLRQQFVGLIEYLPQQQQLKSLRLMNTSV